MKKNFLEKIRKCVENRVIEIPEELSVKKNQLDFCEIFKKDKKPCIITEIKFASPSYGRIYRGSLSVEEIANAYLSAGAAALSIVIEPDYFEGDAISLKKIKNLYPDTHLVYKDFVLTKKQIAQALLCGANAVLLIASFLDSNLLNELYSYAVFLGLTPILEVHHLDELEKIIPLSPKVVGINNRSLKSLSVNLNVSRELIPYIPEDCYALCESGIENLSQIHEMTALGFDGFLIGSSLMRFDNPGLALRSLLTGDKNES